MMRKSKIILIIFTITFCIILSFFSWFAYEFYKTFEAAGSINNASDYKIAGKYNQAITEYSKVIQIGSSRKGEGWVHEVLKARHGLIECYEKTGQYEAALKEIDWLIERKVLTTPQLLERKKQIQEFHKSGAIPERDTLEQKILK